MWPHRVYSAASLVLLATSTTLAQDEVPPVDEFLRRAGGRVALLGDRLFYDGGEVSQRGFTTWRHSNPANVTLSIDLSQSWSPQEIEIVAIPHSTDTFAMVYPCMFVDQRDSAFYVWGGFASWMRSWDFQGLWRFSPTDNTRGNWDEAVIDSPDAYIISYTGWMSACASTPDAGFVIGAYESRNLSVGRTADVPVLSSFNFGTQTWELHSEAPSSHIGSFWNATATFVPKYGQNGLMFILGGKSMPSLDERTYIDFRTVHFFDPVTKDWYSQKTTGPVPVGRDQPCLVGVSGANGTFDIFMYGGQSDEEDKLFGEIYVLSLPGFVWTKVHDDTSSERAYHACALVGNRQLLSWGGLQGRGWTNEFRWDTADSFPQGIGIFDMSELAWKNAYDAKAAEYRAHERISSWYENGGLDDIEWSSLEVSALFAVVDEDPVSSSPSDSPDAPPARKSPTSIAILVGGIVGGVAGVVLAISFVWYILRQRNQHPSKAQVEADGYPVAQPFPPPGFQGLSELQGKTLPAELADGGEYGSKPRVLSVVSELDASDHSQRR